MKWLFSLSFLLCSPLCALFTQEYWTCVDARGDQFVWEVEETAPFDALLLSWNGSRPEEGELLISLAVRVGEEWTQYIPYMRWGSEGQASFKSIQGLQIRNDEDCLVLTEEALGEGFRVRLEGEVKNLTSLTASLSHLAEYDLELPPRALRSVALSGVPRQSQMVLDHPRHRGLCSPTSTAIVLHYLGEELDPLGVARGVYDERADIYGNWVLNTAEASHRLGPRWRVYAKRLGSFEELHKQLTRNIPVIVSVKGEIPGGALPYAQGHLMVVVGYDADRRQVLVVDPAFPSNEETATAYDLDDFLAAWSIRKNLAYVFDTESCRLPTADTDRSNPATPARLP